MEPKGERVQRWVVCRVAALVGVAALAGRVRLRPTGLMAQRAGLT